MDNTITHSISALGGAGSIFKKVGNENYENNLSFEVAGSRKSENNQYINYRYSAQIDISFDNDIIKYVQQNIKIKFTKTFVNDTIKLDDQSWDLNVDFISKNDKDEITIHDYDVKKFKGGIFNDHLNKRDIKKRINSFLSASNLLQVNILKGLIPFITSQFRFILFDLSGGESFNIVPSKVKEQEDAASPPGIKKDGSGLATTLYAMKTNKSYLTDVLKFNFYEDPHEVNYDSDTLKKIIFF